MLPLVSGLLMGIVTLGGTTYAAEEYISLDGSYTPGTYQCGNNACDLDNLTPPMKKGEVTGITNNNTRAGSKIVGKTEKGTINFVGKTEFDAEYRNPNQTIELKELIKEGAVEITLKDGKILNNKTENWESKFNDIKWDEYDTTPKIETIEYTVLDGKTTKVDVYTNIEELLYDEKPIFNASIIVEQPLQPFYQLEIARAENGGELILAPEEDVSWDLKNSKESSLFLATTGGKISVTNGSTNPDEIKSIHVDFGNATLINETPAEEKQFGPSNKFVAGTFMHKDLEGVLGEASFQIDNLEDLSELNKKLIDQFKNPLVGGITPEQYKEIMDSAIGTVIKAATGDENVGNIVYTPPIKLDEDGKPIVEAGSYFLSDAIKAAVGKLAVVEVSGEGSEVIIEKGVRLSATSQAGIAHNLYVTNKGTAKHQSTTYIIDGSNRNVQVDTGGNYQNEGSLVLGYGLDESQGGAEILGDHVKRANSKYTNSGSIFIAQNDKKNAKKGNLALTVSDGADAENKGDIYIGSIKAVETGNHNTASGVMVDGSGTFLNNGQIYLGYSKTTDTQKPTSIEGLIGGGSTFKIDETHNAMAATAGSNSVIKLENNGTIDIAEGATNAVGIHVFGTKLEENESYKDISIINSGEVLINGENSIGMRIARASWDNDTSIFLNAEHKGNITVKGSNNIGIFAGNGSQVNANGKVNVQGNEDNLQPRNFNYGIQAENSVVNFGEKSELILDGSYLVGVRADKGAIVNLKGIKILSTDGDNQTHYWISGWNSATQISSTIDFGGTGQDLTLNTDKSTLFRIDNEATLKTEEGLSSKVVVRGEESIGFYIADKGTAFSGNGLALEINGKNSVGIKVVSGAGTGKGIKGSGDVVIGSPGMTAPANEIKISGDNGIFALVDGRKHNILGEPDDSSLLGAKLISYEILNGANVAIDKNAIGYKLLNNGELVHKGKINFNPDDPSSIDPNKPIVGVSIAGGKLTNEKDALINVNGVGVDIIGKNSQVVNKGTIVAENVVAGIRVNSGAALYMGGDDKNGLVAGKNRADAVLALAGSEVKTKNAQIEIEGIGAGLHFQNSDDKNTGKFILSGSGLVAVLGSGYGIHVEGAGGKTSTSEFKSEGSNGLKISVKEEDGNGILINTSKKIHSGASVNMASEKAKSALVVKGGSKDITQSGQLTSNSKKVGSSVVDLTQQHVLTDVGGKDNTASKSVYNAYTFTNTGQILAKDTQVAIKAYSDAKGVITIKNQTTKYGTAKIEGDIKLEGESAYNVALYGGSESVNTITDKGNDVFSLIDVKGLDDSEKLFKGLDGGAGANKLVLKATNATNDVEKKAASHYVFTDAKLENIANLEIEASSRFELDNSKLVDKAQAEDKYLGIRIAAGGQLYVNQGSGKTDYTFNNVLTGAGLVTTNLGATTHKFNFTDSNKAGHFNGTFAIANGTYDIAGNNAQSLQNAILRLDSNNGMGTGVIKEGSRAVIGGLTFNGGTLVVEESITTGKKNNAIDSILTVGSLDLNKGGHINLSLGKEINEVFNTSTPEILYSKDLLLQDEGDITIQLVSSKTPVISGESIIVVDLDGKQIDIGQEAQKEIGIYQDGVTNPVATGKYGLVTQTHAADSDNQDGLYLSYALESVVLNGKSEISEGVDGYQNALNLQVADGGSANAQEFKVVISGAGDLVINTNPTKGELKLSGKNTYSGATYVISGNLGLLADETLGNTSLLDVASGSTVTFHRDVKNNVGQLNISSGAGLDLGDSGELTIRGDQSDKGGKDFNSLIAGSLTGGAEAELVLEKNKLRVIGANNYAGNVDVQAGTLLELNHTQGVGYNGQIDLAGVLHLNDVGSGVFQKEVIGTGVNEVLIDNNSTVTFVADHTGITNINIGSGSSSDTSRVIVHEEKHLEGADGLATSDVNIRKNSTLELDTHENHWVVNNNIDGAGNLHKSGIGRVELIKESAQYTGKTTVESGVLIAGNDTASLDLQSTEMFIAKTGTFSGLGSINGGVVNEGNFFVGQIFDLPSNQSPDEFVNGKPEYEKADDKAGNTINDSIGNVVDDAFKAKATYTVKGDFNNKGNIFLSNSFEDGDLTTGTNLLVTGDYLSNGGAIFMNTVLNAGHEEASSDKLIVEGNVKTESDSTKLYISNAQGLGAHTDKQPDAIKVVQVDGKSDGKAFVLGNNVAIGVYEYTLHQGRSPENSQSWFLDSYDKNLNPGIGAFIGNQNAAIGMFSMTLHDRMGNLGYSDPSLITEDDDTLNSAWVRIVAERNKYKAIDKQMSIKSNTYLVHLGTDFYKWTDDLGATRRLGVMAGYGHGDIKSRSNTGFKAEGTIDAAYNLGIYGTYYNPNGFYVDAWAQHSWFKNKIAVGGDSKTYRSKLLSLSVELGHTFDVSEVSDKGKQWRLQPQGQLTWHKYKLNNNVVSGSGLEVTNLPSHTTVARLGAKLIYANVNQVDSKMQPFVEVNWLHSNANKAIEFNNWYETSNNAPKNRYELKVGVEGRYNNRWSVWGNVATQMGKDNYRNYRGTLGAKYDF